MKQENLLKLIWSNKFTTAGYVGSYARGEIGSGGI